MVGKHTAPDGSWLGKASTLFAIQDMGELARRLNPAFGFDDRGNVLFWDSFTDGLSPYNTTVSGASSRVGLTATAARSGGYAALCELGAGATNAAYVEKHLPYPALSKLGFQVSANFASNVQDFLMSLDVYDGTTRYRCLIEYDVVNEELAYLDSGGSYVNLATALDLGEGKALFNTVKIVGDFEAETWLRVIVNATTYDAVEDEAIQQTASSLQPHLRAFAGPYKGASIAPLLYLDDIIITQNEE